MKPTILAIALFAASAAHAGTYDLLMSGTGVTLIDGNVAGAPLGSNVTFQWSGDLHIETDASADGVYSGAHLTSFASRGAISGSAPYAVFGFDFAGNGSGYGTDSYYPFALPTVTISGGRVSGVTATLQLLPTSATLAFAEMGVSENGHFWHAGTTYSSGRIETPRMPAYILPVSPVPEPETYAMVLAGLAALRFRSGYVARRAKMVAA